MCSSWYYFRLLFYLAFLMHLSLYWLAYLAFSYELKSPDLSSNPQFIRDNNSYNSSEKNRRCTNVITRICANWYEMTLNTHKNAHTLSRTRTDTHTYINITTQCYFTFNNIFLQTKMLISYGIALLWLPFFLTYFKSVPFQIILPKQ